MMAAVSLPTGFVALVLTDVEGSTRAWDADPDATEKAMEVHDRVVGDVVAGAGGTLLKSKGEGDSTFSVFDDPLAAVRAAADLLIALQEAEFPMPVRVAVHAGDVHPRDGDYYGPVPNRTARLRNIASGGQVLVSSAAADAVRARLDAEMTLVDLGVHELRGLSRPEHVHGLSHPALDPVEPIAEPAPPRGNLPAPVDRFIGRDEERILLDKALRQHRFVTVVGPGGMGKSRLALQVAAEQAGDRPGGTWVVDLADLDRPDQVPLAVAATVGIAVDPSDDPVAMIAGALDRPSLVVLDTCETQLDSAAEFAEGLLAIAPQVAVLATSREPLDARGEAVLRLEPMAPDEGGRDLFLVRAAAADLALGDAIDDDVVARVCAATDGVPLAIELVAGRLAVEAPEELLAALDDLDVLLGPAAARRRTGPARQRSLADTIQWSVASTSAVERDVLSRLTVFAGGWPEGVAESICADDELDAASVADAVHALVRRSLVVRDRAGGGRHRLLDTVRESVRRTQGDAPAGVRARHLQWTVELLERHSESAGTPGPGRRAVEAERLNLRAALDYAITSGDATAAQRLIYGAANWWVATGALDEAADAVQRALALDGGDKRDALLVTAGFINSYRGNTDDAERCYREALALGAIDPIVRADAMSGLVLTASLAGLDNDEIVARAEAAVDATRALGHLPQLAVALNNLGVALSTDGPLDRTVAVMEESAAIEREIEFSVEGRLNLAMVRVHQLQLRAAAAVLEEVELQASTDAYMGWRWWYIAAMIAGERRDPVALAEATDAFLHWTNERTTPVEPDELIHVADLNITCGDVERARRVLRLVPDADTSPAVRVRTALLDNDVVTARAMLNEGLSGFTRPVTIQAMVRLAEGNAAGALAAVQAIIPATAASGRYQWERDLVRVGVMAAEAAGTPDPGLSARLAELDRMAQA